MNLSPDRGAVQHGETRIEYTVVRSRRRRRTIGITVSLQPSADSLQQGAAAAVVVRAPLRASRAAVEEVVRRKAGWIARRQAEAALRPAPPRFADGETLPYLGRTLPLSVRRAEAKRASVRFDGSSFEVAIPPQAADDETAATVRRAMEAWYGERALEVLEASVGRWAAAMQCEPGRPDGPPSGRPPGRVLVRNQKRQWGSCAPDGTLRFNWRLVMLAPSLIDYVVVHELVHLRVRNHSREFWSAVAEVLPDFSERRAKLREVGLD